MKRRKRRITLEQVLREQSGNLTYREVHAQPIFDNEGKVVQTSIYSVDATKSRYSTQSLEESELLNRFLLDSLPHPAMLVGKDKTILAANRAAIELGARIGEKCTRTFGRSVSTSDMGCENASERNNNPIPLAERCPFCLANEALESAKPLEVHGLHAFHRIWDVWWTPIGKDLCLHYLVDITERKRAEELLVQTERIKTLGEMALGVAHNFNNALQVIVGGARLGLLEGEAGNVHEVQQCLQKIVSISLVAAGTLKGLIDFGKSPQGSSLATAKVFDLSKTVAVAAMLSDSFWKRGSDETIRTTLDLDLAEDCLIRGNETEIFEVIVNLIKNSVEALTHGGQIVIKTYARDNEVTMEVADNGVGISREHLAKVFDPFFTTKGLQGTGMGLAACRGIVGRHSGEITVESEPGKGATFRVKLPMEAAHGRSVEPEACPVQDLCLRILLIDDERDVVLLLRESLAMYGHTVFAANSGREALDIIGNTRVDAIICDLAMPEMDGWEVGRQVREAFKAREIPQPLFFLLTGWGEDVAASKSIEGWGVDGIVRKPVDTPTLLARIGKFIQEHSQSETI